jgi:hypothetical protein
LYKEEARLLVERERARGSFYSKITRLLHERETEIETEERDRERGEGSARGAR